MFRLLESIKVLDRQLWNLSYHNNRINRALSEFYPAEEKIDLSSAIKVPPGLSKKLFKCRVIYSNEIHTVEFQPYNIEPVSSLTIVYDDSITYDHKYEDRRDFQKYFGKAAGGDILIVKNGLITDTSYSNVVFSDYQNYFTPATPLLKGTKRAKLLDIGKIREEEIRLSDLSKFKYVYLINAMIDLEDKIRIPIENIIL